MAEARTARHVDRRNAVISRAIQVVRTEADNLTRACLGLDGMGLVMCGQLHILNDSTLVDPIPADQARLLDKLD